MPIDSIGIPRLALHHQVLFHAIDGVVLVKLFLRGRHEITQARVLFMTDKTEIAEGV